MHMRSWGRQLANQPHAGQPITLGLQNVLQAQLIRALALSFPKQVRLFISLLPCVMLGLIPLPYFSSHQGT